VVCAESNQFGPEKLLQAWRCGRRSAAVEEPLASWLAKLRATAEATWLLHVGLLAFRGALARPALTGRQSRMPNSATDSDVTCNARMWRQCEVCLGNNVAAASFQKSLGEAEALAKQATARANAAEEAANEAAEFIAQSKREQCSFGTPSMGALGASSCWHDDGHSDWPCRSQDSSELAVMLEVVRSRGERQYSDLCQRLGQIQGEFDIMREERDRLAMQLQCGAQAQQQPLPAAQLIREPQLLQQMQQQQQQQQQQRHEPSIARLHRPSLREHSLTKTTSSHSPPSGTWAALGASVRTVAAGDLPSRGRVGTTARHASAVAPAAATNSPLRCRSERHLRQLPSPAVVLRQQSARLPPPHSPHATSVVRQHSAQLPLSPTRCHREFESYVPPVAQLVPGQGSAQLAAVAANAVPLVWRWYAAESGGPAAANATAVATAAVAGQQAQLQQSAPLLQPARVQGARSGGASPSGVGVGPRRSSSLRRPTGSSLAVVAAAAAPPPAAGLRATAAASGALSARQAL